MISAVNLSHRYITSRFLPDKAIDLVDEAASKLRLEMNSVPEPIDELNSQIRQLEIEKEAIKRDGVSLKLDKINDQLKELNAKRDVLMKKWDEEKGILSGIQTARQQMEDYKIQAQSAERAGDYGKVAELRYGKMAEAQKKMGEASIVELVMEALPKITANAAAPLANIDKIVMYGEGGSTKMIKDVMNSTNQILEGVKEATGIDITNIISSYMGSSAAINSKD